MATLGLIEYKDASPAVRAVYDGHHGHPQNRLDQ